MDADGVEQVINQLAQGMSQVFGEYNNGDASIPFFRPPLWDSKISQTQLIGGLAWQQLIPGASDPLTTLAYYYPITITGEIVPADATGIHVNNWDGTESGDLSFHRIDSGLSDLTSPFPHVLQEIGLYNSPESLNSNYGYHYPYVESAYYHRVLQKFYGTNPSIRANVNNLENANISELDSDRISEWYAKEIDALVNDEDPLNLHLGWLSEYENIRPTMKTAVNLEGANGGALLIRHAIIKAIDELVESGVDVGSYLGKNPGGNTWFDEIGASSVLGQKSPNVFPNPADMSISPDDVERDALSDTRYINYCTMMSLLHKLTPASVRPLSEYEDDFLSTIKQVFFNASNK